MSNRHLDTLGQKSVRSIEAQGTPWKRDRQSIPFSSINNCSIKEEYVGQDIFEEDEEDEEANGERAGEPSRGGRHRPPIARQGSFPKRHSSFDTPHEVSYPDGISLSRPQSSPAMSRLSGSSAEVDMQPYTYRDNEGTNSVISNFAGETSSIGSSSVSTSDWSELMYSTHSSMPFPLSTSPQKFDRYVNPRPAPIPPGMALSDQRCDTPLLPDSYPSANHPVSNGHSSQTPSNSSTNTQSSPLFESSGIDNIQPGLYRYVPPMDNTRHHFSLPTLPRLGSMYMRETARSRPASLPHTSVDHDHNSPISQRMPPPDPPRILAPSPPHDENGKRKPAAYEPFLPSRQCSPDDTFIAVHTSTPEYKLLVKLPGFQRDAITLAMRKRRVLHIVADNWNDAGGHFERRVAFGYDADLASVKAEFDGETLKIVVPRRILPPITDGP